jgi:ribosomal-protein-serine acetyltransferase
MTGDVVLDLGDGLTLAPRDESTVEAMHELTMRNLDRLRAWEHWAHGEQTRQGMAGYTRFLMDEVEAGRLLAFVMQLDGRTVGAISLRLDRYLGTAELGFWIDHEVEGRELVTRAAAALIDRARAEGMSRVELRTGVANDRSRRVAERIGMHHEGTLRSALPVGEARQDVAIYGLVLD